MSQSRFDAAIVGAGAVGLACALAMSRAGLKTCLIGPAADGRDGRTAALLDGSLRFLDGLGLGRAVEAASWPLRILRLVDDTGSLFRPPPVEFRADEIGLGAFGRNIENAALVGLLSDAVARDSRIAWRRDLAAGLGGDGFNEVNLSNGDVVVADLVVAADGRRSALRQAAGLPVKETRYDQAALTTVLRHQHDHDDTSTEFHTRAGPFTLVPLADRRSSLVWVTRPEEARRLCALENRDLARRIERQSRRLLGTVEPEGLRAVVPLGLLSAHRITTGRLVLIGEAAHALPPIGAQGLNLGLTDAASLASLVAAALARGQDIGGPTLLARYERMRRRDVGLRSRVVDNLNRTLMSDLPPFDALRGIGLGALARLGPLRRLVMRAGVTAGAWPRVSGGG